MLLWSIADHCSSYLRTDRNGLSRSNCTDPQHIMGMSPSTHTSSCLSHWCLSIILEPMRCGRFGSLPEKLSLRGRPRRMLYLRYHTRKCGRMISTGCRSCSQGSPLLGEPTSHKILPRQGSTQCASGGSVYLRPTLIDAHVIHHCTQVIQSQNI